MGTSIHRTCGAKTKASQANKDPKQKRLTTKEKAKEEEYEEYMDDGWEELGEDGEQMEDQEKRRTTSRRTK